MQLILKILKGSHIGEVLKISREKFLIGRADECHLRPNSERISRHHCLIQVGSGTATVRDLGSRNGTLVNGEATSGEHELKKGDTLEVGPLAFEVSITTDVQGTKKSVVTTVAEAASRTVGANDKVMDIENWLTEDAKASGNQDETMIVSNISETLSLEEEKLKNLEDPEDEDQEAKPKAPRQAKKPKDDPNSRSAAADALRKLMNRR
ncbi:MAG: FHA domain-containing protein [Planctomycetales bacterium]